MPSGIYDASRASMRPRRFSPRKCLVADVWRRSSTCFNEAAAFFAAEVGASPRSRHELIGFNEAAAFFAAEVCTGVRSGVPTVVLQ